MITSIFKKSTPLNFSLVVFLILSFFFIYQIQDLAWTKSLLAVSEKIGILVVLLGSVFITNFISNKNGISKESGYVVFFYFLFLIFFPSLLDNPNLIFSNFFILLALRRLISLQSLNASKEKIFDASLWIFVASMFHFWSILYIVLVFISIIFHVSRDYRNWILPFIAFFSAGILFLLVSLIFNIDYVGYLNKNTQISFDISYFTSVYQNAALSIYATVVLFFVVSNFASLSNRPLVLHATYKKIIASLFIGIIVYVISANKSNDLLVFTIAPLAMLATSHIELPQVKLKQEMVLVVLIMCSFFTFFSQL
ncbi:MULTISPECIES: DUF6427 family protein [unclassified Flavobacterium]|uniref:DUF6427 family protein n=1 Tax=unclassified Flavobacterium TaxID=196869 RepID=UPI00156F98DD|nr:MULTISPECIES: DUF6427 family protein [unclassified Flavobacterium]MBE0392519.1 hypothetical protein [Flavobacterium sp. PL002]NRT14435.1 hypothetical protein [Flavobacterium sp. 28A]